MAQHTITIAFTLIIAITLPSIAYTVEGSNCPHDLNFLDESSIQKKGIPLYYWQQKNFVNFGDYLSLKLVERIVGRKIEVASSQKKKYAKKLLAIGSIMFFAYQDDVLWGTGYNGKVKDLALYDFTNLDVRAVRGPLTRQFLVENFGIECPEIYGDPALLMPYFFPEFQRPEYPPNDYIVIPHYSENKLFPKDEQGHIVYSTDPWDEIIQKILDSQFVISSSLHGIVVAEAYGIPARLLRVTEHEPLIKYQDYYLGTNRPEFHPASSVEEALEMGGEPPFECDLNRLYQAFPMEFWFETECKQSTDINL
ncbi:MAG: polysaccharide pyruvyl transferase family protein [Parachlamydiaceae bacterium]